jgi:hypothetical protein
MATSFNSVFDVGVAIDKNSHWLGKQLTELAHEAMLAHEKRRYATAVNRGGVFLEALVKKMLTEWSQPIDPQSTFGKLIGLVRKSGRATDGLCNRLDEANKIRNRSAHDSSDPTDRIAASPEDEMMEELTAGDSLHLLTVLASVTMWHSSKMHPVPQSREGALPIFLSVGGPHRLDQQLFLRWLRIEMNHLGVELHSLESPAYSQTSSFAQIVEIMGGCRAALVVGMDRSHSYAVFDREASGQENKQSERFTSTSWSHIEGSIAFALKLPLVVLRESRVHEEGIFEAKNHRHELKEFELQVESKGLSEELRSYLATWVQSVRKRI